MRFLPTRCQIPFFFLLFFSNFLFSTLSSPSTHKLCLHEESVALHQFKNSFSIEISASWCNTHPKTESWKEGTDCCLWDGVSCNNVTGHVIGLDLSCSCLFGSFPSNSTIFLLSQLQRLNLSHNDFNGSKIPSQIGGFSSLTHLNLSYSEFSGQVPKEISHLSHLVSLDISSSYFLERALELESITLKRIAQNFSQIRELILDFIDMSTVDSRYVTNLSYSIASLSLFFCRLRGKFPKTVLFFPSLKMLDLGLNGNLTVELPKSNWSSPLQYLCLDRMNLSGKFPDSIKELKSLEKLYLYSCNKKGSFPVSILNLTQIVVLYLSSNHFSGPIPSYVDVSGLSKLTSLYLDGNLLNGSVPSWLFSLPSLRSLDLSGNQLAGTLKEFPQSSLSSLFLGNNSLQGSIPSSISNFVNLTRVDLSLNKFSGVLDFNVFSKLKNLQLLALSNLDLSLINSNINLTLPNLTELRLSTCNLSEFPIFLKESISLLYLDLSNNKIQDSIPKWLWNIGNETLDSLDLSNNKIQGSIPEWLWNIGNETLRYVNLSHNSFVGNIDQLPWTLEYLDLQSNSLQGVLPIPPSQITFFSVSKNNFIGEIPSLICNASFLKILDLSHNQLSGKIPSCFRNLSKSLSVLDLQANSFHGNIPSTFGEGCQLKNLIFCKNQFEGQLPRSLINCKGLEVLDISNNNIEDTFPDWLDTLSDLQVLELKSNKFHGSLSNSHTNPSFPMLRILDLSNNDFCGTLPTQIFNNLRAIMKFEGESFLQYMEVTGSCSYHYSVVMVMKGFTIEFQRTLNIFMSIDLSNNKFEGEISEMIGKLSLLKGLNFSYNNLSGHIPSSIRNLTDLEWLDLSSNQLAGNIPQELVEMTSLEVINFSYNQLVGPIPQGKQFSTFENTSYEGNVGLCGLPLSKTCSPYDKPKSLKREFSESIFEFGWKIVVVGYGCGFIFGLGIGCRVSKTRKLKWFVSLIEGDGHEKKSKGR